MEGGTFLHPNPQAPFPLGPFLDQGLSDSWPSDIPAYTQYPQDCGDAISQYELTQDMQAYQGLSVARHSDSVYPTTFPWSTQLALPGSEGCFPYASEEDPTLGDVDATHSLHMGRVSMHASLDGGPDNTTRDPTVSSTFAGISRSPTVVQYEEQSASRYQRQELEKRPTAASSYSCNMCNKVYAQPQGVKRHHREAHKANICTYCGDFKWGRRYQFRKHLKKHHPNVDPDVVLSRLTGSHRNVIIAPKHSPQQQVSSPTPEHDRQGLAEPRLCALAPVSLPVISSLDYHPQPENSEPMNTTGTGELQLLEASTYTCASAAIPSTEEYAQWPNDLEIASQNGQIWYQNNGLSARQGTSTAASCQGNLYHPYDLLADTVTAQPSWNPWLTV